MSLSSENTAPHHLHRLLSQIRNSGQDSFAGGWTKTLDAEWGSTEFARRHSEVVSLFHATIQQLHALPERSRDRSLRYVPDLWNAIVQPQGNWNDATRSANSIIGQDTLDHLEATADIISGSLVGSAAAPRGADLEEISKQCCEWIDLLGEMHDSEIDGPLKDELISQIEHLRWLVDNAHIFGGARVSAEASRVIGSLAQASTSIETTSPETASRWKNGWLTLIAACIAFNVGAPVLQESITSGSSLVKEITGVVSEIRDAE